MTAISDREKIGRDVYKSIGDFMFAHGLDPSPTNYMLLHQLITGSNPAAVDAIKAATSDGLRLTQREADRIMDTVGIVLQERKTASSTYLRDAMGEVQRQMESFSELISNTRAATKDYGQDLESSANELISGGQSLADLIRITSAMLERTRAAESQLEAATGEAEALRQKLVSAQHEARVDLLTGIPNRRAFEDHYAALVEQGVPLSLAICDLDRFKAINDNHGHGVGDRVLKTVAEALSRSFDGNMVARLGGEEFVVVLPDMALAEAAAMVEEARRMVADKRLKVRDTDTALGQITLSAGVAYSNRDPLEDVLRRADTLLYQAKAEGRDRVAVEPDGI